MQIVISRKMRSSILSTLGLDLKISTRDCVVDVSDSDMMLLETNGIHKTVGEYNSITLKSIGSDVSTQLDLFDSGC